MPSSLCDSADGRGEAGASVSNSLQSPCSSSSAFSSSSSSSSRSQILASDVFNLLWMNFLISFSKNLTHARAQSLLLPGESDIGQVASCPFPDPELNYRPVIGIVSHPGDGASGRLNKAANASYIAASYVKFVEAAGARVIPLIYNEPEEVLLEKLNLVNGVLFTGGWAKSGLYYDVVERIFKEVLQKNDAGDHFPLIAICLGFELTTMIVSQDKKILESFSAQDQSSTLQFVDNVNIKGSVFRRFSPELLHKLTVECLAMQNHQCYRNSLSVDEVRSFIASLGGNFKSVSNTEDYGISPERFRDCSALSQFFEILTTSKDKNDKTYVSTIQAYNYPVFGFQWHPEKNAFEWGLSMIPHSEDAVQVTQNVANFFVSEARKSLNRPPPRKVLDNLIYNYSPTFCGKAGKGFDEVYIFSA